MDASNLTFHNTFDRIFSNAALHRISDHQPVLTGIARILQLGGSMVIQMGGKGNADPGIRSTWNPFKRQMLVSVLSGFLIRVQFFGTEEYREWIIKAGLLPVRAELIPKDMTHQTRESFAGWIRTTWHPYLQRIPTDLHTVFIESLINQYLFLYPADEEGIIYVGMV